MNSDYEISKLRQALCGIDDPRTDEDYEFNRRIKQIIPANGWMVWYYADGEGDVKDELFSEPLVAWGLRLDGLVVPLGDGGGYAEELNSDLSTSFVRITGPGQEPPSMEEAIKTVDRNRKHQEAMFQLRKEKEAKRAAK